MGSRVVPPLLAALTALVLVLGIGVMARGLAYAYGVPGLIALVIGCGLALVAAVVAVRRNRTKLD